MSTQGRSSLDYRIIYIGAQTVYGIVFLTLLLLRRANMQIGRLDKLDVLYILFIITTVLDSIWIVIDGVAALRTGHILLEIVELSSMATASYIWFLYMLDYFSAKSLVLYKYRFLLSLPYLIQIALIATSVWTGLVFTVNVGGTYERGVIHFYTVIVNYLYMVLGSYIALRCRRDALLTIDRRRFAAAALFPVPVLLFSLAQILLPPGFPGIQGGVLVSLLVLYGISQNVKITQDHLTGLPNRFAFEQDLLERMRHFNSGNATRLFLFEGDLNKFKFINDTYGHPAGDAALIEAAHILRDEFSSFGAVVFRTGGDEFMMIAESENEMDISALTRNLNERLRNANLPEDFELSITLGVEEYDGQMDIRSFITAVDQKLYASKHA